MSMIMTQHGVQLGCRRLSIRNYERKDSLGEFRLGGSGNEMKKQSKVARDKF